MMELKISLEELNLIYKQDGHIAKTKYKQECFFAQG